jgi:probable HAF family extracellular repeat protein
VKRFLLCAILLLITHLIAAPKYKIVDLGTLGGTSTSGAAINASGQVTGTAFLSGDTVYHAFLYSNGNLIDLDTSGGRGSEGLAINTSGQVAGYFNPTSSSVDNAPTLNTVKAGSAVPVKFSLGGNQGLNILAASSPVSQSVSCSSSAPVDTIEETVTAGSITLQYDASTGLYSYIWKTDKGWSGTCRQLNVKLNDGSEHKASFKFLK